MGRLMVLHPLMADLGVAVKSGVVKTDLDGGLARYRRDRVGNVSAVNVTWRGHRETYEYLRAFYRAVTLNGSEPFDIYLRLTGSTTTLYEGVYFVPKTFRWAGKSGDVYTVSAQIALIIAGT